jgi:hypothetical protein
MKTKIPSLTQLLCPHKERMTRHVDGRIFTVCFECGHESRGVEVGGFVYSHEAQARMEHSKAVRAWESMT